MTKRKPKKRVQVCWAYDLTGRYIAYLGSYAQIVVEKISGSWTCALEVRDVQLRVLRSLPNGKPLTRKKAMQVAPIILQLWFEDLLKRSRQFSRAAR